MTTSAYSLSVLVPVYRSEATLRPLLARLQPALATITNSYEIILINDGSPDRSGEVIRELAARDPRVRGIQLMRNFGQHNALLCGIRAARNEVIVTLDDDLQNPPEEISKLLAKLDEGYDVVYGAPRQTHQPLLRNLATRVIKLFMQSAMGAETARQISSFRVFRTPLREAFAVFRGPFVIIDVLLTWGSCRFAAAPVQHNVRAAGQSNYTLRKLVVLCFNMMTSFSTFPLQIASWIGFAFTLFGIGVLIYVVGRYLMLGYSVPGWPFLASIIAIFSGAQLFALGIIGEYLARMHFSIMDRPTYVIRQVTENGGKKTEVRSQESE